jgi:hypothetical protein
MSKSALSFLVLALMAIVIDMLLPLNADAMSSLLKITSGLFIVLFIVALIVGRKIKFDPLLR